MAILLLLATGCRAGELRPAAIDKDDVCAACKMAISEPRYAAQIVNKDGDSFKFDDIACMLRFAREHHLKDSGAAFFVMDYDTGKNWLDARKAAFVKADEIQSPMASGLGGFRDRAAADAFVARNKGRVFTFDELLSADFDSQSHAAERLGARSASAAARRDGE